MPKSKEILSSSESGSDSDEPKPKKKKEQGTSDKKEKKSNGTKGPNGEIMFEVGKMRYATISEFRGKQLVSIREYYNADAGLRPGKKGISLTLDQWKTLKDIIPDVDEALKNM